MFPSLDSMEMLLQKIWIDKSELLQKAKVSEKQTGLMYTLLEWENQHGMIMYQHLDLLSEVWFKSAGLIAKTVHPVVSTMLPKANNKLGNFLQVWCSIKNEFYNGEAGLQFSINSTDDEQRNELFDSKSLSLAQISRLADELPMPVGRKYTLNFPVTSQTILDAKELSKLFDREKFIVKITPIHETASAIENGFQVTGYSDYDVYRRFEQPLLKEGWDVIVFVPSKEEDSDRITCGNALISEEKI